jgi:hypothetical protein
MSLRTIGSLILGCACLVLLAGLINNSTITGHAVIAQGPEDAKAPHREKPLVTFLYPKEGTTDGMLWPNNHTWIISVDRLDPTVQSKTRSLAIRAIHKKLEKGEGPTYGSRRIAKTENQSKIRFGKCVGGDQGGPTIVRVQVINLNEAEISLGPDKRPLRLLLSLGGRGGTMYQRHVIEGDYCGGMSANTDTKWKDGELHLMNFWAVSEERVTTYDVVLLRPKDDEPTGR